MMSRDLKWLDRVMRDPALQTGQLSHDQSQMENVESERGFLAVYFGMCSILPILWIAPSALEYFVMLIVLLSLLFSVIFFIFLKISFFAVD